MMESLNYAAIKTSSQVREAEEQKSEQRKKNLLILMLHHLLGEGYSESAKALESESNLCFNKFEVCDNVDLETILMEYESYYYVKFQKYPKVTKKISAEAINNKNGKNKKISRTSSTPILPKIPHAPDHSGNASANTSGRKRPTSSTVAQRRQSGNGPRKSTDGARQSPQVNGHGDPLSDLSVSGSMVSKSHENGTSGGKLPPKRGPIIDMRAMLNNAVKGATQEYMGGAEQDSSDRLLKPLGGYAGYSLEWRELAQNISKDIYLHNPDVRWDDIIGLDAAKRLVKEAVVYPIKYPQLFTGILSPWKGLLLYGPPGTGKTLLAKAVATECNTTFFNISASSIVSKWRGDSEKLVRVLFELARFHAPSTIFLDELESVMGQRGGGGNEHEGSRRMKTELLVQMDGLAKTDDLVFLLAASNLPWELDHAMLRRLEKRILVDLPVLEARKAMIEYYLPSVLNPDCALSINTDIEYDFLAEKTEGYSGSDLRLVCKEAAMRPVRKIFDILESTSEDSMPDLTLDPITTADVEAALAHTKPSAKLLKDKYLKWQKEYESV
ncbi:katanin p60 ATPase-containing subunit A-like 2 isoform X4 [Strongylocentrotus purpuratus]|uniref:Katanin p60 ATPase-containing subunit A-like 2 n=1 Tax=Strongylocentrotus purpuratus TaxID=7668 RepID=A0A7M7NAA7_STRPU|nr:katanin p60 ATPase-containing subunit A-like 2 isoform X4 [Strongylocentrotus purpuratus]